MKYRISKLEHDCKKSADAGISIRWEFGKWWEGEQSIKAKKPKCRFCGASLYDPAVCNHISSESALWVSPNIPGLQFNYTALFIQKADRRLKEFKA